VANLLQTHIHQILSELAEFYRRYHGKHISFLLEHRVDIQLWYCITYSWLVKKQTRI